MNGLPEFPYAQKYVPPGNKNTQVHPGPFETLVGGKTRTQILKQNAGRLHEAHLYTVPIGKTLYITCAQLSHSTDVESRAYIVIRTPGGAQLGHLLGDWIGWGGHSIISLTYPMPIMVLSNNSINVWTNFGYAYALFCGFIE